jgi:aminopeptidase N
VEYDRPDKDLALLAQHDTDAFARWEAGRELAARQLLKLIGSGGDAASVQPLFIEVWRSLLQDTSITDAYKARVLALPGEKELLEKTQPLDPLGAVRAVRELRATLGRELSALWLQAYEDAGKLDAGPYSPDPESAGHRALRNLALSYLMAGDASLATKMAVAQYYDADNMTDAIGGLAALVQNGDPAERSRALDHFYQRWQQDPLVMDKWFTLQATAPDATVETVRALMLHPAFSLRNPNRARSLVFQFCMNNLTGIHNEAGYAYWAEQVLALDALNPEIAARLARAFDNWARYAEPQRTGMRAALEKVQQHPGLSRNVAEIVSKALKI